MVVQSQLEALGLNVEIVDLEWGAFLETYVQDLGAWDLAVIPQVVKNEPSQTLGWPGGGPGSFDGDNPQAQEMVAKYFGATTIEEAQAQYDDIQQFIEDQRPLSRLGDLRVPWAATTALQPLPVFDSMVNWWSVDFAK